jgi:hypothetical protein
MPVVMQSAAVFGSSDSLKPDGHTKMRGAWERFWKLTRLNKANISVERDGVLSLLVAE